MNDLLNTLHAETMGPARKKRDKVRSAWISFAGRIAAQLVGAIATVVLGVIVLHRYTGGDSRPPARPAEFAVTVIVVSPETALPADVSGDDSHSADESRERQTQMARAIGKAVAGALSSSH
jgi:hypothetical protein